MENILKSRRFLPLLFTQFFGALNDNLFKNSLLILVTIKMADKSDILSNVIAGLFILPFFLFSALAGQIADKYDRAKIARILKITELVLMCLVALCLFLENIYLLTAILCLMGVQSAFFGPVKYALLPQQLKENELIAGNAYVEATTYLAIILGLVLGTLLPLYVSVMVLIVFAIFGLFSARFIIDAPAPQPNLKINKNIFSSTFANFRLIRKDKTIFKAILGVTWFWSIGALIVVQVYPLTAQILKADATVITFFLAVFSIGVGIGSIFCNKLLKGAINMTYVPISALFIALSFFILAYSSSKYQTPVIWLDFMGFIHKPYAVSISISMFFMAFFGGLYIVPLNALVQERAPKKYVASIIAGNNILNAFGMCFAAVYAVALLTFKISLPEMFFITGIIGLFIAFYISSLLPDALARSILQFILKSLFRVKVDGTTNYKKAGKRVLIIANHTSLIDAMLIAAFLPEKITFAINTEWSKKWFIRLFSLVVDLYPLDPTNPMAIRSLIEEVKKDKRVMIFPEGRITVTGSLMKVYEGAGVVAEKAKAEILPIRINGAQYSKFSYLKNKVKTKFFPKISLTILPCETLNIANEIKGRKRRLIISKQLYDLMVKMVYETSNVNENLFISLLSASKIHGETHAIAEDINRKPLNYKNLIKKSYVLGEAYKKSFLGEKYIGLMLPNTLANVVSFFALIGIDKVPAMMNFSQGIPQIISSVKTVGIKTIVTSHKFISQAHLEPLEKALIENSVNLVYLEEFSENIRLPVKAKGFLKSLFMVKPKNTASDTAVVLFTSGSEGMPKAVLLSHKNLQANRYQISSVLSFNRTDIFFNALPMFHSFGLSIGTVLTILSGIRTFFYPSPLHYRIVPELVYDTNATIICGTDTFFYGYGRMAHPYDFFNIKYAVVGGEKLKETTANLWAKKFGVRILEGYGATETSPVLCINTPMYIKENSVGRLLPLIDYKIEKITGIETGGVLKVKGDNIMQGYMKSDKPEVLQPLSDGWYDTGDIVETDENGFISIKGRMKRFAKIGGEMISLTSVEQTIDGLYPSFNQGIVTLPDDKKGEQIILITSNEKANIAEIKTYFKEQGYSELSIPKKVVYMKKPPVLGTGKFDYQMAKKILLEENNA